MPACCFRWFLKLGDWGFGVGGWMDRWIGWIPPPPRPCKGRMWCGVVWPSTGGRTMSLDALGAHPRHKAISLRNGHAR